MSVTSETVERLVVTIRLRLDYPNRDTPRTYLDAVEALDALARLARGAEGLRDE